MVDNDGGADALLQKWVVEIVQKEKVGDVGDVIGYSIQLWVQKGCVYEMKEEAGQIVDFQLLLLLKMERVADVGVHVVGVDEVVWRI